jgi:hypothetical protein
LKTLLCTSTAIGFALILGGCSSGQSPPPQNGGRDAAEILVALSDAAPCKGSPNAAGASAGADPLCATTTSTVSFAKDVAPILGGATCSGEVCHAAWQYDTMVNQRSNSCCDHRFLIAPGQPSSSHVIQAITGQGMCIDPMPLGGKLPDATIALLIAWVCQGAPNN